MRSLTTLHLPLPLDVRVDLPQMLAVLPELHDLGARLVGTCDADADDNVAADPDYVPRKPSRDASRKVVVGGDGGGGDGGRDGGDGDGGRDGGDGDGDGGSGDGDGDGGSGTCGEKGAGRDQGGGDAGVQDDVANEDEILGGRGRRRHNVVAKTTGGGGVGVVDRDEGDANELQREEKPIHRENVSTETKVGEASGDEECDGDDKDGSDDDDDGKEEIRPLSRVWWQHSNATVGPDADADAGGGQRSSPTGGDTLGKIRSLRNPHKLRWSHLPDLPSLSELRHATLVANPRVYQTTGVSRWPACFDAQHLASLTLERVTWCNERRFALHDPKRGLFFVLDHAWLPALRTLSLVAARLVPENLARLLRARREDEDDDEEADGKHQPTANRQEVDAARSPLYVARPHTSLGVLARLHTLTVTDSDLCVAVLPRFDGVTRLELAGETRADMGELSRRFPALRDLVVSETTLRRDAESRVQGALPPTPMVGDAPVWCTALTEVATLRTLAIRETAWPSDAPQVVECCFVRESRADRHQMWRPWLDVVAATLLPHVFEWRWHPSEWATTAAPSDRARCCHGSASPTPTPSGTANVPPTAPTPPCARAADCILPWYRAHAPPPRQPPSS